MDTFTFSSICLLPLLSSSPPLAPHPSCTLFPLSAFLPPKPQCNLYILVQAASSSTQGLRAPSSLAVGAAIPTTKQAVPSQIDAFRAAPAEAQAGKDKGPPATAGKGNQATAPAASAKPSKPAVERRPLEGLDEAVANGLRALCQVSVTI